MIGTSVDRYEILEELGHGGMSVVYRGLDSSLEREVAVKVLHNHLAKNVENRRRFHREAKAIARLQHPNILEVYDFSSEDAERSYIVMEYVAGENLRQFIARTGTPPPEVAALIGAEICEALECAHDHGIIHRDLKPENVMVSSDGALKLMDFGIAHVIDAETMTATGSLMGSPAHMAPELIDGVKVDVRADVFALGTVLYWLSTGRLPFEGANAPQVLRRVLEGDYEDPDGVEPRIGGELCQIIRTCLAHDPDDRYTSVDGVRKDLQRFSDAIGLEDRERELKRYFMAPEPFREEFNETIVARLTAQARVAQQKKDVPAAIGLFNRILAYDPDNAEVQRLLDRMCRQDQWRRMLPAVAAVAVVVGIAGYLWTRPSDPPSTVVAPPPPTVDKAVAVVAEGAEAGTEAMVQARTNAFVAAAEDFSLALGAASERANSVAEAKTLEPVRVTPKVVPMALAAAPDMGTVDAAPALVTHLWKFSVLPAAATFKVDDRVVSPFEASTGIELAEGPHRLSARGPGTKPWARKIDVRGPSEMPVVLEWDSGRVQISSNVPAVMWHEGRPRVIGRSYSFVVPFGRADSTETKKEITLRLAPADNVMRVETRKVIVQPGRTSPLNVNFNPVP